MKDKASVAALAAIVAAAAAFASTAASGVKHAAHVSCGVPITTDVTLDHDLLCAGDGLELEPTSPITVNLNGHTVRGSGTGTGVVFAGDAVLMNGTITSFATGIDVFGDATLRGVRVLQNGAGITAFQSNGLTIAGSTVIGNLGDGIHAIGDIPNGVRIRTTTVAHNAGYGVHLGFAEPWSITASVLNGNRNDGLFSDDSTGQITDSVASYNRGSGIHILDTSGAFFPYVIRNNTARANGEWGIVADVAVPQGIDGGGNVASGNGEAAQCLNVACSLSR